MAQGTQRIELSDALELVLPDGSVITLKPGPRGKGLSIVQAGASAAPGRTGGRGRGRPPRPSTIELRAMLEKDAAAGGVKEASHYIEWLVGQEPKVAPTTLQQTAYREMRAIGGAPRTGKGRKARAAGNGTGKRGRQPNDATVVLREKLQKDAGALENATTYIRWLVDKADIGIKQARPIVYRELRAAKSA